MANWHPRNPRRIRLTMVSHVTEIRRMSLTLLKVWKVPLNERSGRVAPEWEPDALRGAYMSLMLLELRAIRARLELTDAVKAIYGEHALSYVIGVSKPDNRPTLDVQIGEQS